MLMQPKAYMDKLKLRHHSYGTEKRRNMSKMILEHGTPFPKPIEYSDIDQEMFNWVDKKFNLEYDGVRLPTYKLYSTQRISEYAQTWSQTDDYGNMIMNFKTITRENNPQKGENQGSYFNIPGHKDFAMFYVPVLQENGIEAYDKYTMKQPFAVNFMYSVSIITNKMELLNEMNEMMLYEFNAITSYISPNDHPMPLSLEDISDQSEYTIDDRKYYSQTFKIKLRGYIIRREDYKVERIPSRLVIASHDSDATGIALRRGKNRREDEKVQFLTGFEPATSNKAQFLEDRLKDEECEIIPLKDLDPPPPEIFEPLDGNDDCCEKPERYIFKSMKVIMRFDDCTLELSFVIDKDMMLEEIEVKNVGALKLFVNNEEMDFNKRVKFVNGDEIRVEIDRERMGEESEVTLVGYDPNTVIDTENLPESSLDESPTEEYILINPKEDEEQP
jgi:hypothetical protein